MSDVHDTPAQTAVCFACKSEKPAAAFSRNKARLNGLCHVCKTCRSVARMSAEVAERRKLANRGLLRCCKCGTVKPATAEYFRARWDSPNGIEAHCRECRAPLSPATTERRRLRALGLKRCSVCKTERSVSDFRPRGKRSASDCYDCHRDRERVRQQRPHVARAKVLQSRRYVADAANALKIRARAEVNKAITRGALVRLPCAICGAGKTDAHHHAGYDESHWFNVEWLCRRCHLRGHHKAG